MSKEAPQEIAQDLVEYCEAGFVIGPDSEAHVCATGKEFVVFRTVRWEGGVQRPSYSSEAEAKQVFKAEFDAYKETEAGTVLYWRHKPTVVQTNGRFMVSACLVIEQPKE